MLVVNRIDADRRAYAAWLKENDELNKTLARDLGLMKR